MKTISGNIVDIRNKRIFKGKISVLNQRIVSIEECSDVEDVFILPGFIDAHIHIESSLLIPSEFGRIAIKHGTIATVSDPHEIANVLGISGIDFMINDALLSPVKIFFGAPSCVPATDFEISGAVIDSKEINNLMSRSDIYFLSEMMNYPGVIDDNPEIINKISIAKQYKKPIDGHAPGLNGQDLKKYIDSGISTDHESSTLKEAEEKICLGMKIIIREGSSAKSLKYLFPLIDKYPSMVMLCTDDLHPDDLIDGHINLIVIKALQYGCDLFNVLQAASINPVEHYNLSTGTLNLNDFADFIVVDNLQSFKLLQVYIKGEFYIKPQSFEFNLSKDVKEINNFNATVPSLNSLRVISKSNKIRVIELINESLITKSVCYSIKNENTYISSDLNEDLLKIVILSRYSTASPVIGFVKGFGLKSGAVASSISHDSHNIIAIGVNDSLIQQVIEMLVESKGGIAFCSEKHKILLKLSVAGLMSSDSAELTANQYKEISTILKENGSELTSPLMTMAFLSLIVIPELKISARGLFDVQKFEFTDLFV